VRPPLVVIAGPTGAGKSALAIALAQRTGGEIVSADSQAVYRHFDIGTAKPTAAQQGEVPHHLISVADPLEPYSAARFQAQADEAIESIAARGKRPIVVGGTGLYVRVLLHGVVEAPGADEGLRVRLTAEAEQLGRPALHARLAAVDSETAATVKPTDLVRIVRALEIHALTGEPASAWRKRHAFAADRYPYALWVLCPPRAELFEALDRRTRAMFEGGLLDEVRSLIARGYRDAAPMRAVGYAQALDVVEGRLPLEEAVRLAARETRHYAKRQWTWFRKEKGARELAPPYELLG
jgi:tRNA dimethylallyltransferase